MTPGTEASTNPVATADAYSTSIKTINDAAEEVLNDQHDAFNLKSNEPDIAADKNKAVPKHFSKRISTRLTIIKQKGERKMTR